MNEKLEEQWRQFIKDLKEVTPSNIEEHRAKNTVALAGDKPAR